MVFVRKIPYLWPVSGGKCKRLLHHIYNIIGTQMCVLNDWTMINSKTKKINVPFIRNKFCIVIGLVFLFQCECVFERLLVHFNHFINLLLLFSFYVNNVQMAFSWITTYRMRRWFDATGFFFCDLMENIIIPKEIYTHLIDICILVVGLMKLEVVFFLFCL